MGNQDTPALNEDAGVDTSESTTPVDETTTTEDVSEPTEESTEETGSEGSETVESSKKGANARIRELNAKANSAEERVQSLQEKLAELTGRERSYGSQDQYQPQVEPGAEISQEQYRNDIMSTANSIVELKIKQNNALNRIDNEAQQMMRDYPELNPDNDSFDKELSDSINEATMAYVKSNPYSASPKEFVTKMMKPYRKAVTKGVGKETENIARQVSQSALRPTATASKEKIDSELTIKELEKKYGVVY